jgi:hypothetical protein
MEKVTDYTGAPWNLRAVETLQKLWREGVPAPMISQTLGRSEADVRAKAAELKLPQHVDAAG